MIDKSIEQLIAVSVLVARGEVSRHSAKLSCHRSTTLLMLPWYLPIPGSHRRWEIGHFTPSCHQARGQYGVINCPAVIVCYLVINCAGEVIRWHRVIRWQARPQVDCLLIEGNNEKYRQQGVTPDSKFKLKV